jgi:Ca2+-binding RTX toxin-like protein
MPTTVAELLLHPFDDTLAGGAGFATLTGGGLADLILTGPDGALVFGGDGSDGVIGGDGADVIWSGKGADTVFGGGGNDTIHGQKGANLLFGGDGDDLLNSGDNASTLDGGTGDDVLVARLKAGGAHVLTGGSGADRFNLILPSDRNVIVTITDFAPGEDSFTVFGVADTVFMNAGVEMQDGPGAVRLGLGAREALQFDGLTINALGAVYGLAGNDTLAGSALGDTITAGAGDDWVRGFDGDDVIDGAAGNDTLDGGAGNDTLAGGEGDDLLTGGPGNDRLDGWNGNDTLVSGADASDLLGGAGQDVLVADLSGAGAPQLWGGFDADRFDITGPSQAGNVIVTIRDFDLGYDSFSVFGTDERAFLAGGVEIQNGPGAVRIGLGAAEALELTGMSIARLNTVYAFSGDDFMAGWIKADRIGAGVGNDTVWALEGNDTVWGGGGNDLILGGDGNDILAGNTGNDTVFGGMGDDSVHGNRGKNWLYGDEGNDLITSGDEESFLFGGIGDDVLMARMRRGAIQVVEGGAGADVFDIVLVGTSSRPGQMVIADFEIGVDGVRVDGQALSDYIAAINPLVEDTAWGTWVTLQTGEIIKFNGIALADLSPWL